MNSVVLIYSILYAVLVFLIIYLIIKSFNKSTDLRDSNKAKLLFLAARLLSIWGSIVIIVRYFVWQTHADAWIGVFILFVISFIPLIFSIVGIWSPILSSTVLFIYGFISIATLIFIISSGNVPIISESGEVYWTTPYEFGNIVWNDVVFWMEFLLQWLVCTAFISSFILDMIAFKLRKKVIQLSQKC